VRLTKQEIQRLREHRESVALAAGKLRAEAADVRAKLSMALQPLNAAEVKYSLMVRTAQAFVEQVAGRLRDDWDEKSERWQEGEAGQAALALVEEWECAADKLEPLEGTELLFPDLPAADGDKTLRELPEEDD